MILNSIISVLQGSDSIAILPHVSADGDALGSSLALGMALRGIGKEVAVYLEEEVPFTYSFLPGLDLIRSDADAGRKFDVVVALDSGDMARLGRRAVLFEGARDTVNIDHHGTNTGFARHNFVDTVYSAVGEIIYQMVKKIGLDISADMATCLYVAIATDTGGFRFSNTTPLTHQIAAELINHGVNVADITQRVFETTSLEKVRLMGAAIQSLNLEENGRVAVISLTDEMMRQSGAKEEECDGIVNIGRNIRGVEVALMLRQRGDHEVKVNLRSNTYVDVSEIAGKFAGGGHKRAAGCTVSGTLEEVKLKLLESAKQGLV